MNLVRIYLEPKGHEDVVCDFVEVRPDGTLKIIGGKRDGEIVGGYEAKSLEMRVSNE